MSDLSYAIRTLGKNKLFALVSVLIMATGLGAGIYALSVVHSLYKPLPFADGDAIVAIRNTVDGDVSGLGTVDAKDFADFRDRMTMFTDIGMYAEGTALVTRDDRTAQFTAIFTDWNLFELTRVHPTIGRGFRPEDVLPNSEPVAVISDNFWKTYFGGDPTVIDRVVEMDAVKTRIVGVMPQGYAFPFATDVWEPIGTDWSRPTARKQMGVLPYARLKAGVSRAQADAELRHLMGEVRRDNPDVEANVGLVAMSFPEWATHIYASRSMLNSIAVVAALLLLLAGVNVANSLTTRANERQKETAVRVALGAPRKRLILQMALEGTLICVAGAALGTLLAMAALQVTQQMLPQLVSGDLPYWWTLGIDGTALVGVLLLTLISILVATAMPIIVVLRRDYNSILRDSGRNTPGVARGYVASLLILVEVALSCVVLVSATVLALALHSVESANFGVQMENTFTARLELPEATYQGNPERIIQFYETLKGGLQGLPSISSVAIMSGLPGGGGAYGEMQVEGDDPAGSGQALPSSLSVGIIPGSLEALGITLIKGRMIDSRDNASSMLTAVVSTEWVHEHLGDREPIGARVKISDKRRGPTDWMTIVGVVSQARHVSPLSDERKPGVIYFPLEQNDAFGNRWASIAVRYKGDQKVAVEALYDQIGKLDKRVAAYNVQSYSELAGRYTRLPSALSRLFEVCGLIALLIAIAGVASVVVRSITQRAAEVAVRFVVGASPAQVARMFARWVAARLVVGLGIGMAGAFAVSRLLVSLVPFSTSTLMAASGITAIVIVVPVLIVSVLESRRVSRLDAAKLLASA